MNSVSKDPQPGVNEILASDSEPKIVEDSPQSLGAAIPQELFPNILSCVRDDYYDLHAARTVCEESVDPQEGVKPTSLKNCALVSRYWANRCRLYMFGGATIWISSLDHARWFREYSLHGSPRIRKVCDLIKMLRIRQSYDEPRSFLDLVYMPVMRHKLDTVMITGPTPANFPPSIIDTPHWKLSNVAYLVPATTAYKVVSLHTITFPSFFYLVKYMKHFRAAHTISLYSLEWVEMVPFSLPRSLPVFSRRQMIRVTATGCTDNFLVGLYVFAMYADSLIHAVLERDQQWAIDLMLFCRNFNEGLNDAEHPSIYILTSEQRDWMPTFTVEISRRAERFMSTKISFLCESKPRLAQGANDRGLPRPMRIVGIVLTFAIRHWLKSSSEAKPKFLRHTSYHIPDLTLLRTDLEQRYALRSVLFTFDSHQVLKYMVEGDPLLRKPWPHACNYRLAYKKKSSISSYMEIDPVTLEHTGKRGMSPLYLIQSSLSDVR